MAFDFAAREMAPNMAEWDQKVRVFLVLDVPTDTSLSDPYLLLMTQIVQYLFST